MKPMLWLILAGGYAFFTWAAEKRTFAQAALCFLNGGYLAFLCFALLPHVMDTEHFFLAAAAAGAGVLAGFWMECRKRLSVFIFWIVTGCQLLWMDPLVLWEILFFALLGGMGLYHASAGILPDRIEIGKALLSGAGFLFGTFLFIVL